MFDRRIFEALGKNVDGEPSPANEPVFPLPVRNGDAPVVLVFDPDDNGIEIAYEKIPSHERTRVRPTTRESSLYWIPRLVPVYAVYPGKVIYAKQHSDGYAILLEHRNGWLTHYKRLAHLFVGLTEQRPRFAEQLNAGEVLGLAGPTRAGPLRPFRFELWQPIGDQEYELIDPIKYLHRWRLQTWNNAHVKSAAPIQHPP